MNDFPDGFRLYRFMFCLSGPEKKQQKMTSVVLGRSFSTIFAWHFSSMRSMYFILALGLGPFLFNILSFSFSTYI